MTFAVKASDWILLSPEIFLTAAGLLVLSLAAFFAATGIVLGAAYLLWLYQRVFFGEVTNPANAKLPDLTLREQLTLAPLVILAFWIGLYPAPIFEVLRRPSEKIVRIVGGATSEAPALAQKAAAAPSPSVEGAARP